MASETVIAYLDIETTGLSLLRDTITVVGIGVECRGTFKVDQAIHPHVNRQWISDSLRGVDTLYTYNGSCFDLPFITVRTGLDLTRYVRHRDLKFACWTKGLFGGLKAVERVLGIPRVQDIGGRDAVRLWNDYMAHSDNAALKTLLDYNKEDVVNLKALRERLSVGG